MKKYVFGALIGLVAFTIVGGAVALAKTGGGFGFFGHGQETDGIAQILGMSEDDLKAQLETTTLPELLDEKGITHEQLAEARETERLQEQADILGITVDELKIRLEDKAFAQLLDEQGISHTALQEKRQQEMQTRATERLQQMVDDGSITEEQMQERLQNMEDHVPGSGGFHRGMVRGMSLSDS